RPERTRASRHHHEGERRGIQRDECRRQGDDTRNRLHQSHGKGVARMTTVTAPAVESVRTSSLRAFGALLLRDLAVLRKEVRMFLGRTIMQPLLLIFVFTYVFPKIGQGIGGSGRAAEGFSTLLVGGVIASAMIFQGIQAVALPLVQDFGYTREIEDRVL